MSKTESTSTETKASTSTEAKGKKATPKERMVKAKKQPWTLEKVVSIGKNYSSESEWYSQSPASYKSAVAHGWTTQALSGSSSATASTTSLSASAANNVVRMPARKTTKRKSTLKKAA